MASQRASRGGLILALAASSSMSRTTPSRQACSSCLSSDIVTELAAIGESGKKMLGEFAGLHGGGGTTREQPVCGVVNARSRPSVPPVPMPPPPACLGGTRLERLEASPLSALEARHSVAITYNAVTAQCQPGNSPAGSTQMRHAGRISALHGGGKPPPAPGHGALQCQSRLVIVF